MKTKNLIISLLIVGAFGAGIYFKDNAINLYNGLTEKAQELQTIDIGEVVSEIQKQVLTPSPLRISNRAGVGENILLKSKIISETNLRRQENGLSALKESTPLSQAAAAKANDMFQKQYFDHVSPSGVGPGDLVKNYGYDFIITGENLILGSFASEKEVLDAWMASPGHRENIVNNKYTEIGVAIIKGNYKGEQVWIGVQEFGRPMSSCRQPDADLKNEIDLKKPQLDIIFSQINELKTQIDQANSKSAVYRDMVENYNKLIDQYNSLAAEVKKAVEAYNIQVGAFNQCVASSQ